jgi:hypothetical protein
VQVVAVARCESNDDWKFCEQSCDQCANDQLQLITEKQLSAVNSTCFVNGFYTVLKDLACKQL